MITPEFLQGCSDEQINMGVAWLEAKRLDIVDTEAFIMVNKVSSMAFKYRILFNPCNHPNEAWPIMTTNKIGAWNAEHQGRSWMAKGGYVSELGTYEYVISENTNPLRAAMEVYLLMGSKS